MVIQQPSLKGLLAMKKNDKAKAPPPPPPPPPSKPPSRLAFDHNDKKQKK